MFQSRKHNIASDTIPLPHQIILVYPIKVSPSNIGSPSARHLLSVLVTSRSMWLFARSWTFTHQSYWSRTSRDILLLYFIYRRALRAIRSFFLEGGRTFKLLARVAHPTTALVVFSHAFSTVPGGRKEILSTAGFGPATTESSCRRSLMATIWSIHHSTMRPTIPGYKTRHENVVLDLCIILRIRRENIRVLSINQRKGSWSH